MIVSDTEIKSIFDKLNITVDEIVKISTLSNFVVKTITNKGKYFLKIYDNKVEDKTGYKLAHLYPKLLEKGIPVPTVLKFDDSLTLIKYPYLVISEIKGDILSDKFGQLNKNELSDFYYELGHTIAKIHSITFDKFGETFDGKTVEGYSETENRGPFIHWKEMHNEIIKSRLSLLHGTPFEDLIDPIKQWFEDNVHLTE